MGQLVIEIAGIGQATSIVLTKHGFKTVADVASASIESLSVVPGFANARSLQTIKKAKDLLKEVGVSAPAKVIDSISSEGKAVSNVAKGSIESLSVVPGSASARPLQMIKKAKGPLEKVDVSAPEKVIDSVASEKKTCSKKQIKNKKASKKSKNKSKDKKIGKNKLKLEAKNLAKKAAKLKDKKAAKGKAKKASSKAAAKKKSSKKSKKK